MQQVISFNIHNLVPHDWFSSDGENSVWISGYRMYRLSMYDLPNGPIHFDLHGVRVFLAYGSVNYLNSKAATPMVNDDGTLTFSGGIGETQSPVGAYLMLLLPFDKGGQPGDEKTTRARISEVIGLLTAVNGRNMAFDYVFDYEYVLGIKQDGTIERRVIGSVLQNPFVLPVPDISKKRLDFMTLIDSAIAIKPELQGNRISLALRWYQAAIFEDGVDAFVKLWIAIETIAMPDTTNIKPIIMVLARIYGLTQEDAESRFQIGRIFGLRGRIIHRGEQISPRIGLLEYLQAIFEDLFFDAVGQPTEKRIDNVLNNPQMPDIREILQY